MLQLAPLAQVTVHLLQLVQVFVLERLFRHLSVRFVLVQTLPPQLFDQPIYFKYSLQLWAIRLALPFTSQVMHSLHGYFGETFHFPIDSLEVAIADIILKNIEPALNGREYLPQHLGNDLV